MFSTFLRSSCFVDSLISLRSMLVSQVEEA